MRVGLRARLILSYLLVLVVSMAIATFLFLGMARRYVERKLGQQLEEEATFIATSLGLNTTEPSDLPLAMGDFQQSFPHVLRARITILSTDGQILSDTAQATEEALPDLEQALSGKLGTWTREESGRQMVHATVPILSRGSPIGLVDLSTPLQDQQGYNDIRGLLLVAFGASLPLSWILAAFLARSITLPIARIKEAAQKIAEGELQHHLIELGHDELADLGHAINQMSSQLDTRMTEIVRARTRLSTLLDTLVDGVVAIDSWGRVSFMNPAAEKLLERLARDVEGKPLAALWDEAGFLEMLTEVQQSKGLGGRELQRNDRSLQVAALPYGTLADLAPSPDPDRFGIVVMLRDVTELRRLEELRSTFLSSVSHELRTPLTIIKGFAVTLMDSGDDPAHRRALEVIDRETDRLSRLVDDLLELSRLRSHRLKLETSLIEGREVVEETVQQLTPKAKDMDIALQLDAAPGPVLADRDRLKQIVVNLVDNALKFTPANGEVRVRTGSVEDGWKLEVEDTGLGIPADEVPFLFERFFRGQDGKKRGILGTGLGLSIVKELVDAHGGRISVTSVEKKGTTFTVVLPVQPPEL